MNTTTLDDEQAAFDYVTQNILAIATYASMRSEPEQAEMLRDAVAQLRRFDAKLRARIAAMEK